MMIGMDNITVIFSGMAGSGKTSLAKEIANRFALKYLCGGDALKELAYKHGYKITGSDWWETTEGMRFLSERKTNPEFDKEVDKILLREAEKGGASITSWALPWLEAPGIKIWVDASQEVRAKRIAERDKISVSDALDAVKIRDTENTGLYNKLYGFTLGTDFEDFDLLLDANTKNVKELADEIEQFLKEKIKID